MVPRPSNSKEAKGPHVRSARATAPKGRNGGEGALDPAAAPASPPAAFVWDELAQYKAEKRFLDGYPPDQRSFFSPRDDIHPMLASLLASAQHSLVLNMYGY